jgi:hypothetical protein
MSCPRRPGPLTAGLPRYSGLVTRRAGTLIAKAPLVRAGALIIGDLLPLSGGQQRDDLHLGDVDLSGVVDPANPVVAQVVKGPGWILQYHFAVLAPRRLAGR